MRRLLALALCCLGCCLGGIGLAADADFVTVERGRYLAVVGDCTACHTAPGGQPFAGGRAVETPFGTVLASNITPDQETGIGAMTDDQFVDALQKGLGRGGRRLFPAMPYTYTTRVTREDALAIRAYLATLPPVRKGVVENQLPFPFGLRASVAAWNALYFDEGRFRPRPDQSAEWNRGAYLVEGLAHCGMCHTPKTLLGGDETGKALQGYALQGWFAPNITDDGRRGLGGWPADEVVAYLRTGHNRFASASGPMAEEVSNASAHMTDADLRAIAAYLKSRPGQGGEQDHRAIPPDTPEMRAGRAIYADLCSACHTPNGAGIDGLFPRLAGSPGVQSTDPANVVRVILRGAQGVATPAAPTAAAMPSFAWVLSDAQVAAVATFVRNAWGNAAPAVLPAQVWSDRASLARRTED